MEEYKPNSHKYNESRRSETEEQAPEPKKKIKVTFNKSLGQRFKDMFFSTTIKDAICDVAKEVIVPAVKDVIYDAVMATVSSLLGRDMKRYFDKYERGYSSRRTREDYHRPYNNGVKVRPAGRFDSMRFEFDSRHDAEEVLHKMNEHCQRYDGVCPVSSFYNFIDFDRPNDWTHDKWGWSWDALDKARIVVKSNGSFAIRIDEPDTYID